MASRCPGIQLCAGHPKLSVLQLTEAPLHPRMSPCLRLCGKEASEGRRSALQCCCDSCRARSIEHLLEAPVQHQLRGHRSNTSRESTGPTWYYDIKISYKTFEPFLTSVRCPLMSTEKGRKPASFMLNETGFMGR